MKSRGAAALLGLGSALQLGCGGAASGAAGARAAELLAPPWSEIARVEIGA